MGADWYPTNRPALRAWFFNLRLKRPDFQGKYDILKANDVQIDADCDWFIWWADTMAIEEERSQQLSTYFNVIAGNDSSADVPASPTWTAPPGKPAEVPPGIEKRIRDVRREVTNYGHYASADGQALGFESAKGDVDPSTVKPDIKTFAAATGYMFSVVIGGREKADQWEVSVAEVGTNDWKVVGTFTGKSGDVTYTGGNGKPVQLQVRVQLRKSNANYGQPSDIVLTTVNA